VQDQGYFDREVAPHLDGDRIKYVGSLGPRRRNEVLGGAAALLHPIAFDEPFGLSVIEAMACGTPVIAFDRGSMPELIEHGVCGFLVRTVDEAARAVSGVQSLSRRTCRRRVVRRFSADRMVEDYLRVYGRILRRPVATLLAEPTEPQSRELAIGQGER
jgi:glycosyltransferase involved in cell wall biosynthesis